MPFNLIEFQAQLNKRGYMPANKFQVTFNLPSGFNRQDDDFFHYNNMVRDMGLWIDGSVLPGIIHNTVTLRRYSYGTTEKRPLVSDFPDVQLRVMSDATGMAWELFRRWMMKVNNFDSRAGMYRDSDQRTTENAAGIPMQAYESSYPDDYTTSVVISVYTPDGNELKRVILTEAFPSAMSDIELAWDNNDQIARFTVNLAYQDWYIERT